MLTRVALQAVWNGCVRAQRHRGAAIGDAMAAGWQLCGEPKYELVFPEPRFTQGHHGELVEHGRWPKRTLNPAPRGWALSNWPGRQAVIHSRNGFSWQRLYHLRTRNRLAAGGNKSKVVALAPAQTMTHGRRGLSSSPLPRSHIGWVRTSAKQPGSTDNSIQACSQFVLCWTLEL